MIFEEIVTLLETQGYRKVQVNVSSVNLYTREQEERQNFIFIEDTTSEKVKRNKDEVAALIMELKKQIGIKYTNTSLISIILTEESLEYKSVANEIEAVWLVDLKYKILMIYENQEVENKNLRDGIENILLRYETMTSSEKLSQNISPVTNQGNGIRRFMNNVPICCFSLVLLNVLVFVVVNLLLDYSSYRMVIREFGESWVSFGKEHKFYVVFTAMFLHSDYDHIFNNMIVLFFVGQNLERLTTKPRFFTIYFGSGIIAGLVSMGYNMLNGNLELTIGASGAIFGLVGSVLYIVLQGRGKCREITKRRMLLFVFFSLYGGFTTTNVDNVAHIGGFIAGILLTMVLYHNTIENNDSAKESVY